MGWFVAAWAGTAFTSAVLFAEGGAHLRTGDRDTAFGLFAFAVANFICGTIMMLKGILP